MVNTLDGTWWLIMGVPVCGGVWRTPPIIEAQVRARLAYATFWAVRDAGDNACIIFLKRPGNLPAGTKFTDPDTQIPAYLSTRTRDPKTYDKEGQPTSYFTPQEQWEIIQSRAAAFVKRFK